MSRSLAEQLRRLLVEGSLTGLGEGALLDRFIRQGDTEAFVVRHGPMVLAVCRGFLHNHEDVEDAFQATFLVHSRKASVLRKREAVGPWLYGVAFKVATRARARAYSRPSVSIPLENLSARDESPEVGIDREEAARLLHEELARLPEAYRAPVVLCHFEGLTHDEAADRLRWPVGTVRGRLARARGTLRDRLTRRGLDPASTNLADARFRPPLVPLVLVRSVTRSALPFATRNAPLVAASPSAVALAREVLRVMILKPLLTAAALSTTLLVTVAGPLASAARDGSDPPKPEKSPFDKVVPKLPPVRSTGEDRAAKPRDGVREVVADRPSIDDQDHSTRIREARRAYDQQLERLVIDVTDQRVDVELGTVQVEAIKKKFGEVMDRQLDLLSGTDRRDVQNRNEISEALDRLRREMSLALDQVERARVALNASESRLNELRSRPRPTERIEIKMGDHLIIEALEALPGRPISGERVVRADGTVSLGFHGDVYLAGLTTLEAKERFILHLRRFLSAVVLGLEEVDPESGNTRDVAPRDSHRVFVDITRGPTTLREGR
ncbi:MAG: sigma-70 family RNA polymerase sigma factor [Isosphaeraceae bacterium]